MRWSPSGDCGNTRVNEHNVSVELPVDTGHPEHETVFSGTGGANRIRRADGSFTRVPQDRTNGQHLRGPVEPLLRLY